MRRCFKSSSGGTLYSGHYPGAGLTTLLAAESTGAQAGLGMRIRTLQTTFETNAMLGYIILIGIIGTLLNIFVDLIERRLTSWQEKREI